MQNILCRSVSQAPYQSVEGGIKKKGYATGYDVLCPAWRPLARIPPLKTLNCFRDSLLCQTNTIGSKSGSRSIPSFIMQQIIYSWYVHGILAGSSRS